MIAKQPNAISKKALTIPSKLEWYEDFAYLTGGEMRDIVWRVMDGIGNFATGFRSEVSWVAEDVVGGRRDS